MTIEKLCIDAIRCLSMDAIQKANSGHPGAPMGLAPAGYALWAKAMRHNPANPAWPGRDRFVLSCGHASMLLYSILYLAGYGISLDDIKDFRQWGSKTPGHPELGHTPGVETTTGPLGQGIGNAVGMAIAERWLAARFNRPGFEIISHHTFVFAGDGDLMEGVAMEAASLAGHLGLEKLVVLWDDNRITIEGSTDLCISEDIHGRFRAQGWRVLEADGHDAAALAAVFQEARKPCGKPTLIACRTIIGWPSPNKQNSANAHGAPLGVDEVRVAKRELGWDPGQDFAVPEEALAEWRKCIPRGAELEGEWNDRLAAYGGQYPDLAQELGRFLSGDLGDAWRGAVPVFDAKTSLATREASGQILIAVAEHIPNLIGGSADLGPSNNTLLKGCGEFSKTEPGRNLRFGIREHAMGAILSGIALHGGLRPYGGTFLVFCDYMRPAMRLAAQMKLPVIYVFTHDSIGVGEDGPTHQPIEQTMSMRLIPGLTVIRPADATETAVAWSLALAKKDGPVALVLSRQKLPTLDAGKTAGAGRGGYVLEEASSAPDIVLVATGSEVHTALEARSLLEAKGLPTRIVSLPSWEIFMEQDSAYRDGVIPHEALAMSVEAGSTLGWQRFADASLGIDSFGASAPAQTLFEKFGITPQGIIDALKRPLGLKLDKTRILDKIRAALAVALFAGSSLFAQEGAHSPRPNRHPIFAIFPDPLPDGRMSLMMEASSQFLRPDFENSRDGRTFARIDGEEWGLTADLPKKLGPIVINLRLRGVWRSGGWADQVFASWHTILGVAQGGRNMAPKFRLDYTLQRDGVLIAQLTKDRACLMDADLAVLYPFGDAAAGGRVGISIQVPTGSRDYFSGSGGWDQLAGIALWKSYGLFTFHTQLECAFLDISDSNPYSLVLEKKAQARAWAGIGCQGKGRGVLSGLGLDISIAYTESPYKVGIPRIDRPGWQQHWTFSHARLPRWRFGISEDAGTYTNPDLTAFFQYRM